MKVRVLTIVLVLQTIVIAGLGWGIFATEKMPGKAHNIVMNTAGLPTSEPEVTVHNGATVTETIAQPVAITTKTITTEKPQRITLKSDPELLRKEIERLRMEAEAERQEMLATASEPELASYNRSLEIVNDAIARGIWEEADFLAYLDASVNMSVRGRQVLQQAIGTAINEQKLIISNPDILPLF